MINRNVRSIPFPDLLRIYLYTKGSVIGEVFAVLGIYIFWSAPETVLKLLGLAPFGIGLGFIVYKVIQVRELIRPLKFGENTMASLMEIKSNYVFMNRRRVVDYVFQYQVNEDNYTYIYQTERPMGLKEGMTLELFYDPKNVEVCIIPQLYKLKSFMKT